LPRQQNVVFEVYVQVQVFLELLQFLISRSKTRARIGRRLVRVARFANLTHQLSRRVVFGVDRIPHGSEEWRLDRLAAVRGAFQRIDVREKNLFFFLDVHQHLAGDISEEFVDLSDFAMPASVLFAYLGQKPAKPWDYIASILVMAFPDMPSQFSERLRGPCAFFGNNRLAFLTQSLPD